jgi:hypothetical protein
MGVGHAAVGIAAARLSPRLNVGWLVFAALLADFLLGIFALLGLESAEVPPDYASRHYLTFKFPYSHGLLSLTLWSLLFAALVTSLQRMQRRVVFGVVAAVVLSHFVLDALVHVVGLPLAGESSPKIGLGLWRNMPLELGLETALSVLGALVFWRTAAGSARSRYGVASFLVLFCALTWSPLATERAPEVSQLVPGWIASPLVLAAIAFAIDRKRIATLAQPGSSS